VRDDQYGYAGLAPMGHGIGVPVADARTASLLARHGYGVRRGIERLVATTSTYRAPVNREFLQLRRSTRVDRFPLLPLEQRIASAMCHFDLERHVLMDHREHRALAEFGLWLGDPEMQVMEGSRAILSLRLFLNEEVEGLPPELSGTQTSESTRNQIEATDTVGESVIDLSSAEQFLISSMVQTLSSRQVLTIETAVDSSQEVLLNQLLALRFQKVEQGKQWEKRIVEASEG